MPFNYQIKEINPLSHTDQIYGLTIQMNPDMDKHTFDLRLKDSITAGFRMAAAFKDDEIVGIAGFWISTKIYCGKYLEPDNVIVNQSNRNENIGMRLIGWLEELADKEKCDVLMLDAYSYNHKAHRFYHRYGYKILGFHFYKNLRKD